VIVEESRRGCSSLFIDPGVEFVLERDEPASESEQERQFPRCRSYLSDALRITVLRSISSRSMTRRWSMLTTSLRRTPEHAQV